MKRVLIVLGFVFGAFLVVRAVVEVSTLDYGNPSSYEHDWGGPSLFGVLAVHCLPGVIALAVIVWIWRRRRVPSGG
jgi:hypothetical protein